MTISPSHLARLDDLTRRYARYSRNEAGLGAVWAGLCLAAVGGFVLVLDLLRYAHRAPAEQGLGFWRFELRAPLADPTPAVLAAAVALPAVWLLGRHWIQRRVYERAGTVIGREQPQDAAGRQAIAAIELVLAVLFLGAQGLQLAIRGVPADLLPRAGVTVVLAAAMPLVGRRLAGGLDRSASLLLLIGSLTIVTSGFTESRLVSMLAYGAVGIGLAGSGLRAHWRFVDLGRELAQLAPPAEAEPPESAATPSANLAAR